MRGRAVFVSACLILSLLIFGPFEVLEAENGEIDVVINEIMYDLEGTDDGKEWIELYNNGTAAVNITNWSITDQDGSGDDFIFPEITFPSNTYIVVITAQGVNDTDFSDGVAHLFFGIDTSFLTNTGDEVLLKNETGYGIDYVAYQNTGSVDPPPAELSWSDNIPTVPQANISISLHPNGVDTDSGDSWEKSDPTPGRTNAHFNDDPPIILDVKHSPLNPNSDESVTVTTNVSDRDNVKSVTLQYIINGTEHFSSSMSYDGINFTAQIPAHVDGTVIEYYICATDDAEQKTSSHQYVYACSDSPIHTVVNEFLADPSSDWDDDGCADYKDEWIELYNMGSAIVNLGNWKIDDSIGSGSSPYSIPFGIIIQPNEALEFYRNITDIALDNNGDNLTLLNETNVIIDNYNYSGSKNDVAIGRFPDGTENWEDFLQPTPGAENRYTVDSLENLSNVKVNEFMPSPKTSYSSEWVELYNNGTTPVRLDGCWLDDTLNYGGEPYQIPLNTTILPGEFWVLNEDRGLNKEEDTINFLYVDGSFIIDNLTYTSSEDDVAIGRFPDGTENWEDFLQPTPGEENRYTVDSLGNLSNVKINEFMPSPKTSNSTEWIELYNDGTTPVSLDGCWLDDAVNGGKKPYQIPLNTTIQPGGFQFFNRSFGLNNRGDTVNFLYADCSTVIDTHSYDSSEYDISFGRGKDGDDNWLSFSSPTPCQPNTAYHEPNSSERKVLISEFFYIASDSHEFLNLYNPSDMAINIGGWRILDGQYSYSGTIVFPEDTIIPPLGHICIAHKATIFYDMMGSYPDFEYGNSSKSISQMITREEPSFSNERDELLLLDSFGNMIDIVVYGGSEYEGQGWNGIPIPDATKGETLKRNFDESNLTYSDTNTSLDWKHIRHYKVGQSDFKYESYTYIGNMTLFASPDSSYETIINEIEGAENTIYINLYQFTNWNISEKIIERLEDGVKVKVLMEGAPADGIAEEQKYALQKIFENGGEIRFLAANSTLGSRYRYTHAKYAIIDNTSVIISSENWKYTGIPLDNTFGNRGWGVVVRDNAMANYFADVFLADWNSVIYDIVAFTPADIIFGNASLDFEPDGWIETGYYKPAFPSKTLEGEFIVSPVLSPDTSLLESDAILGMINSAVDSIYIEQLDVNLNWNDGGIGYDNLYLKAAIKAAEKRKADVRFLLSSAYAYPDDPDLDNYDTFVYINDYASNHNITDCLEARLVDYDRLGFSKVHNKGLIVDGSKTLISSINWNRNSVTQNREVGVIIESEDVAEYFTRIFLWDWNEPPTANAGGDITVKVHDALQFDDLSLDSDNSLIYFWDFDDGTNSTQQNPTHIYKEEGIYEVRLTVSDGQYSDSDTITVIVLEEEIDGREFVIFLSVILLLVFLAIIVVIIVFIRRMRRLFT